MPLNNDHCKPGTLLRSNVAGSLLYDFRPKPVFDYNDGFSNPTHYSEGDFFIWLQADLCRLSTPYYYCFCLHNKTGRIVSMPTSRLEIVDLKGEVE